MSEIEMKVDKEVETLKKICTKLTDKLMACLDAGFDQADATEVGLVVDMIKDLTEAKEKAVKGLYYKQIMEAMEENNYGEDYDENGPVKYYRGRSARTGRYVHRPYTEMMDNSRDMDRSEGKMYYSDAKMNYSEPNYVGDTNAYTPSKRYYSESKYDRTRKGYKDTKDMNPGDTDKEQEAKMKSLDEHMASIMEDFDELVPKMDKREKTLYKNRLQEMQNKVV